MTTLTLAPASRRQDGRASRTRRPVRLTALGRVVVVLVLALVTLLAVSLLGRAGDAAADPRSAGAATRLVVVQPGDSLWTIARAVAPEQDPREVVNRLQLLNHLRDSVVVPGQPIVVPARG